MARVWPLEIKADFEMFLVWKQGMLLFSLFALCEFVVGIGLMACLRVIGFDGFGLFHCALLLFEINHDLLDRVFFQKLICVVLPWHATRLILSRNSLFTPVDRFACDSSPVSCWPLGRA